MNDKKFEKIVTKRLAVVQSQFDITKSTFLTAGLLVAIGLSEHELKRATLFGLSGIKVVLGLTILAAIAHVLSFVVAEYQVKRHDKLIANQRVSILEWLVLRRNKQEQAVWLGWFFGRALNTIVSVTNNIASGLLLLALILFFVLIVSLS